MNARCPICQAVLPIGADGILPEHSQFGVIRCPGSRTSGIIQLGRATP